MFCFQNKNPKGPVHTGVVSNNIHGADKSVLGLDISRWRKREEDKLPGFSLCKRKRFPPADEGKGPFNNFSLHGGCCQTRWGSLRCLPPATSRNKWSKPAPFQANFFPVRLEPAGRRGVVSPERSSPWLGAGGRWVYAMDNFLVSVLTSTHTREGTGAASKGAPGRGVSLRRSRRGRRAAGEAATAAGRRERAEGGGPRASTSSAIFQTFDPFRKARRSPAVAAAVPPRSPGRQRAGGQSAGPSRHLPRAEGTSWLPRGPRPPRPARAAPHPLPSAGAGSPPRAAAAAAPLSGHARTLRTFHAVTGFP